MKGKVYNIFVDICILSVILVIIFTLCTSGSSKKLQVSEKQTALEVAPTSVKFEGDDNSALLYDVYDGNYKTSIKVPEGTTIEIGCEDKVRSIYIVYELSGYKAKLEYNDKTIEIGQNDFIHEFIELDEVTTNIRITYEEDAVVDDIYMYAEGEVPSYVQKWQVNDGKTDLLLLSTHGDDEHLMFAGLIPTYVARGYDVQVVYMTNHENNPQRFHEQLNGLWAAGVTNYPEFGPFPDQHSHGIDKALENLQSINLKQEDIIKWQTEILRKYKPDVVVGHAENGEYGHGQHILNSKSLEVAVKNSNNAKYKTDNYNTPWDVKKLYIHLYDKNQIVLDIDTPLDYYDGLTAFQVSQVAFKYHTSQVNSGWVYEWLCGTVDSPITSSSQITKYFPNQYGLYYSTVGDDVQKNDMFENIETKK